jgi:hypothetical protein
LSVAVSSDTQIDLSQTAPNDAGSAITGYEIEEKSSYFEFIQILNSTNYLVS